MGGRSRSDVVTERSEQAAEIAFAVVLIAIVIGVTALLALSPGDAREAIAGFLGGLVAVLAVGVARWIGGGRSSSKRPGGD